MFTRSLQILSMTRKITTRERHPVICDGPMARRADVRPVTFRGDATHSCEVTIHVDDPGAGGVRIMFLATAAQCADLAEQLMRVSCQGIAYRCLNGELSPLKNPNKIGLVRADSTLQSLADFDDPLNQE